MQSLISVPYALMFGFANRTSTRTKCTLENLIQKQYVCWMVYPYHYHTTKDKCPPVKKGTNPTEKAPHRPSNPLF